MTPAEIREAVFADDRETARTALDAIPCFPLEPWAREILEAIAGHEGHPFRYDALLKLNSFARPAVVFLSALGDPREEVRCAAYCGLAVRNRLEDWARVLDGAADGSPVVRETVFGLLFEWIHGSDVDGIPPLPRVPGPDADPRLAPLLARFRQVSEEAASRETGETLDAVRNCLGWLQADPLG